MKIIIDISENDYELIKASVNKTSSDYRILEGTILSEALEERPTGHWKGRTKKCSRCGYSSHDHDYISAPRNFCPNCGADMRVKDKLNNELKEIPQTIGCFNCKHAYKRITEEPCKYCNEKCSEWQDEHEGGRE